MNFFDSQESKKTSKNIDLNSFFEADKDHFGSQTSEMNFFESKSKITFSQIDSTPNKEAESCFFKSKSSRFSMNSSMNDASTMKSTISSERMQNEKIVDESEEKIHEIKGSDEIEKNEKKMSKKSILPNQAEKNVKEIEEEKEIKNIKKQKKNESKRNREKSRKFRSSKRNSKKPNFGFQINPFKSNINKIIDLQNNQDTKKEVIVKQDVKEVDYVSQLKKKKKKDRLFKKKKASFIRNLSKKKILPKKEIVTEAEEAKKKEKSIQRRRRRKSKRSSKRSSKRNLSINKLQFKPKNENTNPFFSALKLGSKKEKKALKINNLDKKKEEKSLDSKHLKKNIKLELFQSSKSIKKPINLDLSSIKKTHKVQNQLESNSLKRQHAIMSKAIKPMQIKESKKQKIIEESKRKKRRKRRRLVPKKQVDPNFQKMSKTTSEQNNSKKMVRKKRLISRGKLDFVSRIESHPRIKIKQKLEKKSEFFICVIFREDGS